MRLTDFIHEHHEEIIAEWVAFARTLLPEAEGMNETALRDHADELLTAIVEDMQSTQTTFQRSEKSSGRRAKGETTLGRVGQQHAIARLDSGFKLGQLVGEYRALRASVLRLWEESHGEQQGEVTRFNETIDEALTEATDSYSDFLDRTREQVQDASFRLLVESVSDYAIFMLDLKGKITSWNSGAEHMKGFTADEIIGQHYSRLFTQEDVKAGKCEQELEVAAREGRFEDEVWRVRKDGSRFGANVILTRVLDANGRLIGFAKVTRDLTERRKMEAERASRAVIEAELAERKRLDELREQLLGIVGHDLRGPLQSIMMATTLMMRRGALPEAETKAAALVARNADRMQKMVAQLLDFTRTRLGGGIPLEPRPVELAQVVNDVVAECEAANPTRLIALDMDVYTAGVWDRDRLGQVVANLLGNAIQHSDPTTPVDVRVVDEGMEAVQLIVHNSGPPIPAELLPVLFDPFRRGVTQRGAKEKTDSLGLGLYIVREIVQAHQGKIDVESSETAGTIFTVWLPRTPSYSGGRS